jgi:hypothetical protein
MQNEEIKNKAQFKKSQTLLNKFLKYNIVNIDYKNNLYTLKCDCGKNHTFDISPDLFRNRKKLNTIICTECSPINNSSSEKEILLINFIKEIYDKEIIERCRNIISPYELDIYLPNLNLAIEFNGIYWHSELHKSNNYHIIKLEKCLEKGIKLIQIFEDNWDFKLDIIKSKIKNMLGKTENKIYARKCEVKPITDSIENFLNENHLQGNINSKIKLGLYYNNELVSIMTFGKLRMILGYRKNNNSNDYELLRFCNKLNYNVIGGASKLFTYFIKNYKFNNIISYADRSWSIGNLYEKLGFKFIANTEPNYYYVGTEKIRLNRYNFRKDILVKLGYDKNKSEHEIMIERNMYRIYMILEI